jgi:hypothetical protein
MVKSSPARKIGDKEKRVIQEKCRAFFKEKNIAVPAAWLLKNESPEAEEEDKYDLQAAIHSDEFILCDDKSSFLKAVPRVTAAEIMKIAEQTVGQRTNTLYCRYKRYRITASNFGYVIAAIGRNSYPISLFGRLLNTSNLERVGDLCRFSIILTTFLIRYISVDTFS